MFERFTDRARRVIVLAQEEARNLKHNYLGTEHILLGLIREGEGVAAKALEALGITLEDVRDQVIDIIAKQSRRRAQLVPSTTTMDMGMYSAYPVEVTVGGSTIFVMNVERFEKV